MVLQFLNTGNKQDYVRERHRLRKTSFIINRTSRNTKKWNIIIVVVVLELYQGWNIKKVQQVRDVGSWACPISSFNTKRKPNKRR